MARAVPNPNGMQVRRMETVFLLPETVTRISPPTAALSMFAMRTLEAKNSSAYSSPDRASSAYSARNLPPDSFVAAQHVAPHPAAISCAKPSSLPLLNRFKHHFSLTSAYLQVYKPL